MNEMEGAGIELSDHCLIDHPEALGTGLVETPFTAKNLMRRAMLLVDPKAHFVGLRGGIWRMLGLDRSEKNPNLCNV